MAGSMDGGVLLCGWLAKVSLGVLEENHWENIKSFCDDVATSIEYFGYCARDEDLRCI